MKRRKLLVVGVLVATIGAIAGGIAIAAIPGSNGTISGCYEKSSGKLRLIDAEAGAACKQNEVPVSWSQAARLVCPEGTTLSTGVCIENVARAADEHPNAVRDCADEGRRLPSPGELNTFRVLPEIDLGNGEWTDDLGDINAFSVFVYFVISEGGNGVAKAFDDVPYRCVAGAGIG